MQPGHHAIDVSRLGFLTVCHTMTNEICHLVYREKTFVCEIDWHGKAGNDSFHVAQCLALGSYTQLRNFVICVDMLRLVHNDPDIRELTKTEKNHLSLITIETLTGNPHERSMQHVTIKYDNVTSEMLQSHFKDRFFSAIQGLRHALSVRIELSSPNLEKLEIFCGPEAKEGEKRRWRRWKRGNIASYEKEMAAMFQALSATLGPGQLEVWKRVPDCYYFKAMAFR